MQIAEIDATNEYAPQVAKIYLLNPSEPVATRVLRMNVWNNGTENLYYTHDLQKNVTALFGQSAGRRAQYEHDPYGNPINTTGDATGLNPYRYSSEYYDEDLGLIYYNYRHYNPTDGRWINRDPLEEEGGVNLYAFLSNRLNLAWDLWGEGVEWHHMLPQEVFTPQMLSDNSLKIDIDDAKYGWMLDKEQHRKKGGIHCSNWNKDWAKTMRERGTKIKPEHVHEQLNHMIKKYKELLRMGYRARMSYREWRRMAALLKQEIERQIRNKLKKMAARKAAKQGVKSIPGFGWCVSVVSFVVNVIDPNISFEEAVQSNLPYYGVAYDAYRLKEALDNLDAETDRELSRQLEAEGKGDPTPPQFDCCGNVTQ